MHAGGIKLDYTFSIRQPAIADAVVERIKFDNIYARNQGVEYIGALRHHRECLLYAGHIASVLETVTVSGRHNHGLYALNDDCRRLGCSDLRCSESEAGNGTSAHEITAFDFFHGFLSFLSNSPRL